MIGNKVTVTVDRPMGSYHPKHKDIFYPINYGYIEGIMAPDGEEQDAYILGVDEPIEEFSGVVIAIIHRFDDVEEKWVVAPENMSFSLEEIERQVHFQEQYFRSEIRMLQSIKSEYFNVFYDEKDVNVIDKVLSVTDGTYENITRVFDLKREKTTFALYICPDVENFKMLTGKSDEEYQEWMVGNADYANKRLCLLSPNAVSDRTFEDMLKVCKHEIIHIAFDQLCNLEETNIFIAEGVAVAFAEQIDISRIDAENYPLAKRLSDEEYFYENNGYLYSGVYALYIIKKYGVEAYKRIYIGEEDLDKYLYDGFEKDALDSIYCYSTST